ncbi:unnamed protein product [Brassica rapa subsp. narinosa]|uniref:(rape) hypothetical protein n=1 Tax=Brassica napus TaxID=3708 RepID=A0A816ZVH2_BRANA|nr:unnamed protein product [Brassica napus]
MNYDESVISLRLWLHFFSKQPKDFGSFVSNSLKFLTESLSCLGCYLQITHPLISNRKRLLSIVMSFNRKPKGYVPHTINARKFHSQQRLECTYTSIESFYQCCFYKKQS